jgi:transcriptional regulator with XRE-family HTH domain
MFRCFKGLSMLDIQKMEARRKALGLSQEAAATLAGMSGKQAWNIIATGRRTNVTLDTLNKIAVALACDPRVLIKIPAVKS